MHRASSSITHHRCTVRSTSSRLLEPLGILPDTPIIVAGSTFPGEKSFCRLVPRAASQIRNLPDHVPRIRSNPLILRELPRSFPDHPPQPLSHLTGAPHPWGTLSSSPSICSCRYTANSATGRAWRPSRPRQSLTATGGQIRSSLLANHHFVRHIITSALLDHLLRDAAIDPRCKRPLCRVEDCLEPTPAPCSATRRKPSATHQGATVAPLTPASNTCCPRNRLSRRTLVRLPSARAAFDNTRRRTCRDHGPRGPILYAPNVLARAHCSVYSRRFPRKTLSSVSRHRPSRRTRSTAQLASAFDTREAHIAETMAPGHPASARKSCARPTAPDLRALFPKKTPSSSGLDTGGGGGGGPFPACTRAQARERTINTPEAHMRDMARVVNPVRLPNVLSAPNLLAMRRSFPEIDPLVRA